jgi:hypothetical protein
VKLADCWLVDVILSGVIGNFLVNDVDVTAFVEPSSNEVLEARRDRIAVVRRVVDPLTDDELERVCTRSPATSPPSGTGRPCTGHRESQAGELICS